MYCRAFTGIVKIGYTKNLSTRFHQANGEFVPNNDAGMYFYHYLYALRCLNAHRMERFIHKELAAYRVSPRKEWFSVVWNSVEEMRSDLLTMAEKWRASTKGIKFTVDHIDTGDHFKTDEFESAMGW